MYWPVLRYCYTSILRYYCTGLKVLLYRHFPVETGDIHRYLSLIFQLSNSSRHMCRTDVTCAESYEPNCRHMCRTGVTCAALHWTRQNLRDIYNLFMFSIKIYIIQYNTIQYNTIQYNTRTRNREKIPDTFCIEIMGENVIRSHRLITYIFT